MGTGLFPSALLGVPGTRFAGNGARRKGGKRRKKRSKGAKRSKRAKRRTKSRKMKFGSPAWQKKYKVGKYRK